MECVPIYNANDSSADVLYEALLVGGDQFPSQLEMSPWIWAMLGSTAIGVSGVLPILVIPVDRDFNAGGSPSTFRLLLSFAVGCLLGDVWLHLLPEIWSHSVASHSANGGALWLLGGLLTFFILEKLLSSIPSTDPKTALANSNENNNNNENEKQSKLHISSGYLNLMANSMDNFTHGLAVGASFLVSVPRGVLTTAAILLHEIPHEVGDFAILLRSGFSRWDAVRAQLLTASAGLIGSLGAIYASGGTFGGDIESRTAWMLPFTAGGFLHIALVTILPDLLEETSPTQSLLQLASMLGGVALMGGLASVTE